MLVEKVPDLANLAIGALVFGQVLSGSSFSWPAAFVGVALWIIFMAFAMVLAPGEFDR